MQGEAPPEQRKAESAADALAYREDGRRRFYRRGIRAKLDTPRRVSTSAK